VTACVAADEEQGTDSEVASGAQRLTEPDRAEDEASNPGMPVEEGEPDPGMRAGYSELDSSARWPGRRPPPDASREALRQVGKEVLSSELDPETWAQALAECRGTHEDALALYARIRAENITKAHHCQKERVKELEDRRVESFRDFRSMPLSSRGPSEARGVSGWIDSVFWHVLAVVGLSGCLLATQILWPGLLGHIEDGTLILAVLAMQMIPVVAWWAGSGRRGGVTYPGIAQLTACVALFGSVALSVELLGKGDRRLTEHQWRSVAPPRVAPPVVPAELHAEDQSGPELLARSGERSEK